MTKLIPPWDRKGNPSLLAHSPAWMIPQRAQLAAATARNKEPLTKKRHKVVATKGKVVDAAKAIVAATVPRGKTLHLADMKNLPKLITIFG